MTVAELIAELSKMPQDDPVFIIYDSKTPEVVSVVLGIGCVFIKAVLL